MGSFSPSLAVRAVTDCHPIMSIMTGHPPPPLPPFVMVVTTCMPCQLIWDEHLGSPRIAALPCRSSGHRKLTAKSKLFHTTRSPSQVGWTLAFQLFAWQEVECGPSRRVLGVIEPFCATYRSRM